MARFFTNWSEIFASIFIKDVSRMLCIWNFEIFLQQRKWPDENRKFYISQYYIMYFGQYLSSVFFWIKKPPIKCQRGVAPQDDVSSQHPWMELTLTNINSIVIYRMVSNQDIEDSRPYHMDPRQFVTKSDTFEIASLLGKISMDTNLRSPSISFSMDDTPNFTFFYLGSKFWYFPLYYSFAFVIYVGYLLVKTAAIRIIDFLPKLKESLTFSVSWLSILVLLQ